MLMLLLALAPLVVAMIVYDMSCLGRADLLAPADAVGAKRAKRDGGP